MAGAWRAIKNYGDPVVMEATEAISAGDPVALATNGIAVADAHDVVFGVAAVDIASGSTGNVWTKGVFEVTFGQAAVMGDLVVMHTSKQVDKGTSGNPICGVVVEKDAALNGKGHVHLLSQSTDTV